MSSAYLEISVAASPSLFDELVGLFSQAGLEGFWEEETVLRAYIQTEHWDRDLQYFLQLQAAALAGRHGAPPPVFSYRTLPPQNWNQQWEASIQPVAVTERIVVTPSWYRGTLPHGDIVLTIDPKMSFGTGYHETTRLMLSLIEQYVAPGMKVLDLGTGTGILAIAAVRLGAASAVGVDNDEWSFANARENISLNGVADRVDILLGELPAVQGKEFDLVAANIQWSVIGPLLPPLRATLRAGGVLLLSGLLVAEQEAVIAALGAEGFESLTARTEHEWLALAARTPGR